MLANLIAIGVLTASATSPSDVLTTDLGDFGETYQFSTKSAQFEVTNHSERPVEITVEPMRNTDRVLHAPKILAPHAFARVEVSVTPQDESGMRRHVFAVRNVSEPNVVVNGQVNGFVESVLDQSRPLIDFEVVDSRGVRPTKKITLDSHDDPGLTIRRVLEAPDFVDVSIGDDRRTLEVTVNDHAGWGIHDAMVKLALDSSKQSQVWVNVRVDIHGDVVPFSNPFGFGVARKGQSNEYLLRLDQRDGKDVKLGALGLEGFKGEVAQQECVPIKQGCKLVKLHIADDQPTGMLKGKVLVKLPDLNRTLPVNVWGMLFSADVTIKDLNAEMQKHERDAGMPSGGNLTSALKAAIAEKGAPITMPTPLGKGPLLKWNVQNERQLYGYVIYRGDSETGPLRRINDTVIKTLSTEDGVPVEYRWRDTTAQVGHTYWYQIGTINLQGQHNDLSGSVKKSYTEESATAK